jgi:hypothetical protein
MTEWDPQLMEKLVRLSSSLESLCTEVQRQHASIQDQLHQQARTISERLHVQEMAVQALRDNLLGAQDGASTGLRTQMELIRNQVEANAREAEGHQRAISKLLWTVGFSLMAAVISAIGFLAKWAFDSLTSSSGG